MARQRALIANGPFERIAVICYYRTAMQFCGRNQVQEWIHEFDLSRWRTKMKQQVVSERAILQRVNRRLARDGQQLRKDRRGIAGYEYFLVDVDRNWGLGYGINLEAFADELGVLRLGEAVG